MCALQLRRRQLRVDRCADHRMDEPERGVKAEDRRLGESRCRVRGDVTVEVRERRHDAELRILAEHCRRPGQRSGLARQAREPQLDGARDGGRPDLHHRSRVLGPRRHLLARERVEQRAQQQRVAARRLEARPRERLVGVGGEHAPDERLDRCVAERLRQHEPCGRVGDELREQYLLESLLGWPERGDDEHRQALEPAHEVAEPAQRRLVGPLEVVHENEQRAVGGDVRGQPVQPVKQRERRVDGPEPLRRGCPFLEELVGDRGRPSESLAPLLGRDRRQAGLEQLTDDPVREVVLELASPRLEHLHPAQLGREPHLADEGRLPDARIADDDAEATGSHVRRLDELGQRRELVGALDETLRGWCRARAATPEARGTPCATPRCRAGTAAAADRRRRSRSPRAPAAGHRREDRAGRARLSQPRGASAHRGPSRRSGRAW